jgi:AAA+ superfamily predicted ATPase
MISSDKEAVTRTENLFPEFIYLEQMIRFRLQQQFAGADDLQEPYFPDPKLFSLYHLANFVRANNLSIPEMIVLIVALAPHVYPGLIDTVVESTLKGSGDFPKIGGVRGKNFRGFLPTGETIIFLLGDDQPDNRFHLQQVFGADHFFAKNKVLWLEEVPAGEPAMSGKIILSADYLELLTTGKTVRPHFNAGFPAKFIQTKLGWDDLVLNDEVKQQIHELEGWLQYQHVLMNDWNMKNRLTKGYRVLFHGPPGTGKTLTSTLLGKYTNREVYRIDLSMVVSKYIGETEKNLENLFAKAEAKNWILFFDEADALFGKRTNVRDAHDKYANQEVSYLLQRVEDFDGLVILATNMKNNIDDAFIRRFNAIVKFSMPDDIERAEIWRKCFPSNIRFEEDKDIPQLVKRYELSGGNITNIVQYACLKAIEKKGETIYLQDVLSGIKREMHKEGKPFSN